MTQSTIKSTPGTLEYRQFIVLEDGTEHQVRYNQKPELYTGTDVELFSYTATEGKGDDKKEVMKYAVRVEDARRAKRASVSDSVKALQAQGLSAEDIIAMLTK